jgi:Phosphotransferase enzyme family
MRFDAPDPDAWPALHAAPVARWQPLLDALALQWSLPSASAERLPGGEDCAAFAWGPERVVKVLAPASDPTREVDLLQRVRLPVPTPQLLAHTQLDGWESLLLSRLPGVPLELAWPQMREPERLGVLRSIGALMPFLAAVPPPESTPRPDLSARLHRRFGDEAAALFALAGAFGAATFTHGDLTRENAFAALDPEGWQLSGVLDFGGSFVAPPLLEVVSPALFFSEGRPERLAALLEGAGFAPTALQLAAANLLHPYAQIERDVRMLGGAGTDVGALLAAWTRLLG